MIPMLLLLVMEFMQVMDSIINVDHSKVSLSQMELYINDGRILWKLKYKK